MVLYEEQEITNASISQETDITTITFTRPLAPSTLDKEKLSAIPGDETWLIYAFGADNELENHGIENRGSVLLDLFCGGGGTGSPSATPTMDPTPIAARTAVPSASPAPEEGGSPTGGNAPTAAPSEEGGAAYHVSGCLLYTSPSPRDRQKSRMPSSA